MELGIKERIILLQVLPQEGNFITIKLIRTLQNELGFSEEELKEHNIRFADNQLKWEGEATKEIPIGERAKELIVESLRKLDEQKKLPVSYLDIYEKFVIGGE